MKRISQRDLRVIAKRAKERRFGKTRLLGRVQKIDKRMAFGSNVINVMFGSLVYLVSVRFCHRVHRNLQSWPVGSTS